MHDGTSLEGFSFLSVRHSWLRYPSGMLSWGLYDKLRDLYHVDNWTALKGERALERGNTVHPR